MIIGAAAQQLPKHYNAWLVVTNILSMMVGAIIMGEYARPLIEDYRDFTEHLMKRIKDLSDKLIDKPK
jgi:hypothetical protein